MCERCRELEASAEAATEKAVYYTNKLLHITRICQGVATQWDPGEMGDLDNGLYVDLWQEARAGTMDKEQVFEALRAGKITKEDAHRLVEIQAAMEGIMAGEPLPG